jgi:glycosyltransferase involved in cell wall biosynthesis
MFIGRVDRAKGVFDLLEIARKMEDRHPGLVRWEVCGAGRDFEEFRRRHEELKLGDPVNIRGWTSLEDLLGVYARIHACIVPTRSAFTEGLAMTAAEAILAGRPLLTNPVVPALEVLRPACVEAKTDDLDSYLAGALKLATDAGLYERLCAACRDLGNQFYDRDLGLAAVLKRALAPHLR